MWDIAKHIYAEEKEWSYCISIDSAMSTSTTKKLNLKNCTHEELFKATARNEVKLAKTSVRDKDRVAHPVKHIAAMTEHCVPSETDNISTTRLGNQQFRDLLPN